MLLVGFGAATGLIGSRLAADPAARVVRERARATGAETIPRGEGTGTGTGGVDRPFLDETGRLPDETIAPFAVGLGVAIAATGLIFGPAPVIVGLLLSIGSVAESVEQQGRALEAIASGHGGRTEGIADAAWSRLGAAVDAPIRLRLACEPRRLLDWVAEAQAAARRLGVETALLAQPGHGGFADAEDLRQVAVHQLEPPCCGQRSLGQHPPGVGRRPGLDGMALHQLKASHASLSIAS